MSKFSKLVNYSYEHPEEIVDSVKKALEIEDDHELEKFCGLVIQLTQMIRSKKEGG